MLILGARDVAAVLHDAPEQVLRIVQDTYIAHDAQRTELPHSAFLRLPDDRNRIIALPAFVGGERPSAGVKWIASFPANTREDMDRASAAIILNSTRTGRPEVLLEGSTISAWRTAASAALAAAWLSADRPTTGVTLVGCGVINLAVLRFLRLTVPGFTRVTVYDAEPAAARAFVSRCAQEWPDLEVSAAPGLDDALARHDLVSFATTAAVPHTDLAACRPGTLVLHVSLRDVTTGTVRKARNIVDDADHVCRAGTSLHLAEQECGDRTFIDDSIGALLRGGRRLARDPDRLTIYSPFGLGVLDIAVAEHVHRAAAGQGLGTAVPDFLPTRTASG